MYTRKSNCNGGSQSTQALIYKGYVILLSKYDICWCWSSDLSEGCSSMKEDALQSAQLISYSMGPNISKDKLYGVLRTTVCMAVWATTLFTLTARCRSRRIEQRN